MPKVSAHDTLARQWQLLKWLPRRAPGATCAELLARLNANGFSTTKRTVERDLPELTRHFSIICDNHSKPHRWRWRDGATVELGSLDIGDALALALAEQAIRPLLPTSLLRVLEPRFALARDKLAGLENHAFSRWLEKVRSVPAALTLQPPRIPDAVLQTTQEALLHEQCLEVDYANPGDRKAKTLPLHPLGFVQRGPVAYLVASAYDYDDPRLYALHRISRARHLGTPRRVPAGFTLDTFLAAGHLDFEPGDKIKLKARVSDALAGYLTETPLAPDQKITGKPRAYHLTATVRDSWQLRFWILSQGTAMIVIEPAALRKTIAAILSKALNSYRE